MSTTEIIEAIEAEIIRLQLAKAILNDPETRNKASTLGRRRTMSPEGRANIAAAQKARWAKTHRGK